MSIGSKLKPFYLIVLLSWVCIWQYLAVIMQDNNTIKNYTLSHKECVGVQ